MWEKIVKSLNFSLHWNSFVHNSCFLCKNSESCKSINTNCNYVINCSVFKGVVWRRKKLTFCCNFYCKSISGTHNKAFWFFFHVRTQGSIPAMSCPTPCGRTSQCPSSCQSTSSTSWTLWRSWMERSPWCRREGPTCTGTQLSHHSQNRLQIMTDCRVAALHLQSISLQHEHVIEFCKAFLFYLALTILFVKQSSLPEILIGVWKDVQAGLKGLI